MRMRPSLRCARMKPSPQCDFILASNPGPGKTRLAGTAGPPAVRLAHWPAARPGHVQQLARQRFGELGLGRAIDRVDPFDARLAELARAVALVERLENAPLARRGILDGGAARKRRHGDAVAAGGVDRHLARDESDAQVVDRDRLEVAEIERRL